MSVGPARQLNGKRAVVTGASGGIGHAIVRGFVQAGARVVAADLPGVEAPLSVSEDDKILHIHRFDVDVTQLESVDGLMEYAETVMGGIDILCNTAAVQLRKPALSVRLEEWQRVLDTNLRGTFFACQSAARRMRHGGAIVNLASVSAQVAIENIGLYSVSKAGVAQLTRSLALEWAPMGIRVNAVAPGYIRTPMTEDMITDPARLAWILRRIPLGRIGEPDDVVGPTLFLVSDAAHYVTGQVLFVDGGWIAA